MDGYTTAIVTGLFTILGVVIGSLTNILSQLVIKKAV